MRRGEVGEALFAPAIDVLGMVAEPINVPAARQVEKLEPRLVRYGQQQFTAANRAKPIERRRRLGEMLEHLTGEHEFKAAVASRPDEDVRLDEVEARHPRSRVGDRVGPKIETDIPREIDITFQQLFGEEAFAAAEVQNRFRPQSADRLRRFVVKSP